MRRPDSLYWSLRPRITPGLQNSHFAYAAALQQVVKASRAWLDLGCGRAFVPDWLPAEVRQLDLSACVATGLDVDRDALLRHPNLSRRVVGSAEALPFASGVFDLVTANMVLEHVAHPPRLFREVGRVLTVGGRLLLHTPNLLGYTTVLARLVPRRVRSELAAALQGRSVEDIYPTYYRANTARALRALAGSSSLKVVSLDFVESSPQLIRIAPLLVPEMLWIRLCRGLGFRTLRPCILTMLQKTGDNADLTPASGASK